MNDSSVFKRAKNRALARQLTEKDLKCFFYYQSNPMSCYGDDYHAAMGIVEALNELNEVSK